METIEVTPIAKLRPYTKAEKIKIRVCMIWKSSISATIRKYVTLQCILVDEMNNAVEASASDINCELVASKIDAGSCYEIMNFRTINIRGQYKVMPHETQVIFTGTTLFKKLSTVFPPIPRHRFFLLDFNMLYPRLNKDDILTDVIGHITAVQQLESKQINQRIVQKCDIHIENIRKEELSVTLWADIAEAFCSLSIKKLSLLIIVVFTSLKVKIYLENIVLNSTGSFLFFIDPDILEVNSYKSMFSTCKAPVKILPPSSRQANEAEILRTARRVTIDELTFLDPNLYKHLSNVLTHVMIGGTMLALAVPNKCIRTRQPDNSSIRNTPTKFQYHGGEKLFGMPCKDLVMNQRLIDQQQLPNEFLRLIRQKKIFHLQFGNRKNSFNSSDVLVYNVSDDTAIEPSGELSRAVTISSTTVLSLTSPPETSRESHKRKRESVRNALFTGSEQSEAEEISEVDPKEFDEIPIKLLKKKSPPASAKTDSPSKN